MMVSHGRIEFKVETVEEDAETYSIVNYYSELTIAVLDWSRGGHSLRFGPARLRIQRRQQLRCSSSAQLRSAGTVLRSSASSFLRPAAIRTSHLLRGRQGTCFFYRSIRKRKLGVRKNGVDPNQWRSNFDSTGTTFSIRSVVFSYTGIKKKGTIKL